MDALLASLFDVPVAVCTLRAGEPASQLSPVERSAVGPRWSEKRLREFEAGRHCARTALSRLVPAPDATTLARGILSDADRVPEWPAGVAGSITHTGHITSMFAAAAVSREARSLGIDAELHAPLAAELRERILTEPEQALLTERGLDEAELGRIGLIVFSAKEAFYKCQYPLSRAFLGFHDVEVALSLAEGRFEARFLENAGPFHRGFRVPGRFAEAEGMVISVAQLT